MAQLSSIIGILVWPLTIIVVVLLLRAPLLELIPTLKRLKFRELELEFEREANKILAEAERDLPEVSKEEDSKEGDSNILFSRSRREPSIEIFESWNYLELSFRKLAKIEGIEGGGSIRSLVVGLESHNLISNEILELTLDLAVLRNKVAHADEEVITYDVASAFRRSVERILSVIKQVD